ncbi:hypothetical protein [Caballeronia grimmiae]|uniref:hypothetical protein n=1 Tax=Caballeronia grimmiae TaxID=1071679 RepID=UPI0038B8B4D6
MSDPFSLAKEEYLSLRKEIETQLAELSALERNSLLAVAAVYSWLVVHSGGSDGRQYPFTWMAWAIPCLIAIFGAARAYSINVHLGTMGEYLRKVELASQTKGELPAGLGWETYFESAGRGRQTTVRIGFWAVFILTTLSVCILALLHIAV